MSIIPAAPDQWPGPAKLGLTPELWRRLNDLAWEFHVSGPVREFPDGVPIAWPRMLYMQRVANQLIDEEMMNDE